MILSSKSSDLKYHEEKTRRSHLPKNWIIKFAWFPVRVSHTRIIWFRKYAKRHTNIHRWAVDIPVFYRILENEIVCDAEELMAAKLRGDNWTDFEGDCNEVS